MYMIVKYVVECLIDNGSFIEKILPYYMINDTKDFEITRTALLLDAVKYCCDREDISSVPRTVEIHYSPENSCHDTLCDCYKVYEEKGFMHCDKVYSEFEENFFGEEQKDDK